MEKMANKELEIKVQVASVHKLADRICIIKLEKKENKEAVMRNIQKLNKSKDKTIYQQRHNTRGRRKRKRNKVKIPRAET